MSLTLPYPNMVFVPLDILTAEEMNEITANVDFIANQFPISASNIGTGAVTTTKIANAAVTSDKVDWQTMAYSTGEQIIGKWIDGKTIYRKVVNFGTLPNNTTKTVSLGVSGTIDNVISANALATTSSGVVATFVYSVSSQPGNIRFTIQKVDKTVSIITNTDRTEFNWCYVFIDYTKN